MPRKLCEWCCEHSFNYKKGEEWKFICKKCYKEHYVPVKNKYSLSEFRKNIKKIKSEEEKEFNENCEAFHRMMQEERDLEAYWESRK